MEKRVYRFRDFELEPDERRLSEAGKPIALTPKVFDTLVLLVERSGHVVSKDELMRLLWPRGYVDESNLTKHIWLIRRALGEGDHDSRFIETVPKLGYRFVAPVTTTGRPPGEAPDAMPPGPVVPVTRFRARNPGSGLLASRQRRIRTRTRGRSRFCRQDPRPTVASGARRPSRSLLS